VHAKLASPSSISQLSKSENPLPMTGDATPSPVQPTSLRPIHGRSTLDTTDSSTFSQFNIAPDPLSHQGTSLLAHKKREPNYSELLANFLSWPASTMPSVHPQSRSTFPPGMIEPPPGFIPSSDPHQHLSSNTVAQSLSHDTRKIVNTHSSLPSQQSTHKENRASYSDPFYTAKLTDDPFATLAFNQRESSSPKSFPKPSSHTYHNFEKSRPPPLGNTLPFVNRSRHSVLRHREPPYSVPALSHHRHPPHPIRHPLSPNQGEMIPPPRRREAVFTYSSPVKHRQIVTTSHPTLKD
jgi:hypothetical protein